MPPRKSSRRAFLRGQSAIDAIEDAVDRLGEQTGDGDALAPLPTSEGLVMRLGRRAMACEFEVLLNVGQYPQGADAAVAALDLVDELESQLTVFRDTSEVSQLNQTAHDEAVVVESRLFALLRRAAEIHRDTERAHDITSGPLSKLWGFYRRAGQMPSDADLAATLARVGMHHVQLNEADGSVRFHVPGIEINLGSIGKGYALDRAAEVLMDAGVHDFLLHGGNSSVLARGASGTQPLATHDSPLTNSGWPIGLRHPLRPERRIGEILLRDRALGTSGSGTQFFIHEGRRYGHLLDPRTGRPAEGMLSTTVAAATGADADALATALYVLGPEAAIDYCRRHPEIAAVVMYPGTAAGSVELAACNFAEDELRLQLDETVTIRRA